VENFVGDLLELKLLHLTCSSQVDLNDTNDVFKVTGSKFKVTESGHRNLGRV